MSPTVALLQAYASPAVGEVGTVPFQLLTRFKATNSPAAEPTVVPTAKTPVERREMFVSPFHTTAPPAGSSTVVAEIRGAVKRADIVAVVSALLTAPVITGTTLTETTATISALLTAPLISATTVKLPVGGAVVWNADTGLSRTSAGVLALGNGTAADSSGALSLTNLTALGAILEVGGQTSAGSLGVSTVVYLVATPSNTAAVANATVFATGAAGYYRISGQVWPTTLSSSAWTIYPACTTTPNGATGANTYAIGDVIQLGTTFATTVNAASQIFYLGNGAAIGISTATNSGSNTGGVYSYCVTIERLG